jgi:uncharacterized protein YbjT (DUF2867 family)
MPKSRMNVPIVGATGSIGNLVVEEALREGHHVRALVRDSSRASADFRFWPPTANRNRQLSDHSVPFS